MSLASVHEICVSPPCLAIQGTHREAELLTVHLIFLRLAEPVTILAVRATSNAGA